MVGGTPTNPHPVSANAPAEGEFSDFQPSDAPNIADQQAKGHTYNAHETKETDSGVAMFNAKSGSRRNPLDAAALEATIGRVIAGSTSHFSRDTVVTAPLFAVLPAPTLAKAKKEGYDKQGRKPNGEKLTEATYDGKVYLVQENISRELEAEKTLLYFCFCWRFRLLVDNIEAFAQSLAHSLD